MSPLDKVAVGMAAEKLVTVTSEMTIGHAVPGMPAVYGTPTMILHMEMAAGSAIQAFLPAAYVSIGMMVNIRHLAATPVGRTVRAVARVVEIETRSIVFEVEAWDGDRKIGDGTHRRGIVDVAEFEQRFGVTRPELALALSCNSNYASAASVAAAQPIPPWMLRKWSSGRSGSECP